MGTLPYPYAVSYTHLAQYVPDYMQVQIVDNDLNRCNRLTELLDDRTMIINGDGRDMDLLVEAGLKNTEAFVALTGNSETNILACLAAKRMGCLLYTSRCV